MKIIILFLVFSLNVCAQNDTLVFNNGIVSESENENKALLLDDNPDVNISAVNSIEFNPLKTKIDYPLLAGVGGIYLGSGIAVHIYQRNAWWKDQRRSFHFVNDATYALSIDKIGHFYAGSLLSHAFSSGLEAGNIQSEPAAIWGSVASFLFELYVEVEDGYGPNWGFSPGDAVGDFLGASFSLSQYYFPILKNFQPRFSYLPSEEIKNGIHKGNMIDDYNGQKYWMSLRMKNILPESIKPYWPSFLMLSVGMGVRNILEPDKRQREFYIALDIDAEEIPLYGRGWQFVKNTLNYFHFPMPGIRISPDAAFFVFCF